MKYVVEVVDIDPKIGRKLRRQSNREKDDEEVMHEDSLRPGEPMFTMKLDRFAVWRRNWFTYHTYDYQYLLFFVTT